MPTIVTNTFKEVPPVPAGTHLATIYQIIHIGTIATEYKGQPKEQNIIRIVFELPFEKRVFREEKGLQPYSIAKEYTLSLAPKANLRKDLESWRGKQFTDEETKGFNISVLLGKSCQISVIHKETKQGKIIANINAIIALPKGTEAPPVFNELHELCYDNFDMTFFASLPEWLQNKITSSQEYHAWYQKNEGGHQAEAAENTPQSTPF